MPRRLRIAAAAGLVIVIIAVGVITFWPGPPAPEAQHALAQWLAAAHQRGDLRWVTFGRVEFASNILLFLPIGLCAAIVLPRARWLVVPAAAAASAAIEMGQAIALPGRLPTPRDVIANTVGALLGYLLALLVVRRAARADRVVPDERVRAVADDHGVPGVRPA